MQFIEDLRIRTKKTKSEMGKILGRSPQAYRTLVQAREQLTTRDISMLRSHFGLTDTELLDLIEAEYRALQALNLSKQKAPSTTSNS